MLKPRAASPSFLAMQKPLALGSLLVSVCLGCAAAAPEEGRDAAEGEAAMSEEATARLCPRGATTRGIDVSYHQGTIDWPAVKRHGVAFAIARVSDGAGFVDPAFSDNWAGMRAAGIVRGTYQFFRPAEDPLAQAELLIAEIERRGGLAPGDLPPALDIEVEDGVPVATIRARMGVWLDRVERAFGRAPMIYTAPGFWRALGAGTSFGRYPLWVANWQSRCPAMPESWEGWTFWQHADDGAVAGIEGLVDADVFDGSLAELLAFAGSGAGQAKVEPGRPRVAGGKGDKGDKGRGPARKGGSKPKAPPRAPEVVVTIPELPSDLQKELEDLSRVVIAASGI